jgi:hypothetical protein
LLFRMQHFIIVKVMQVFAMFSLEN